MAQLDFFYDSQIRSYLKQIISVFHGFQYQYYTRDGNTALRQIPVRWGDPSRMAMHIMRNNSENVINSAPFMTISIQNIAYDPTRTQAPSFTQKVQVAEREFDEELQAYTANEGKKYTVERFMPVPWNLTIQLDIWTTNTEQKLQIFEQVAMLFNPTLDIQSNSNALDWSSLTYMHLQDTNFSSRSVPVGTDSTIDILQKTFLVPIWINPPAKVKKQTLIHQIVQNMVDLEADCLGEEGTYIDGSDLLGRTITTPGNHNISIEGNEITLLDADGGINDGNGDLLNWQTLLDEYGNFRSAITQLRIKKYAASIDTEVGDIVGTVELHPTEQNKLLWSVDILTLKANTLDAVDAIIDPHKTFPGAGLPAAATGQRYLLLTDMGGTDGPDSESGATVAWGGLTADADDVIMYNGTTWSVVFDASAAATEQFVVNSFTSKQLYYTVGETWTLAVDGEYSPGIWRLYF